MAVDPQTVKRILIINLAFIGDVLLSTPVARALGEAFPGAAIDMMVIPLTAPLARHNPYINDVIEYDKRGQHKKIGELLKLVGQVRARRYDLAVTTNFAPRGAMLAWAAGIPTRVGYDAQHAGLFLTHTASAKRVVIRHEAENYLDVLKPLGVTTADTSLALDIDPRDTAALGDKVRRRPGKKLVLICPAGSYPHKSWTTQGYAALIQALTPEADCCLVGGKAEEALLAKINQETGEAAQVFPGALTLGELAALTKEADLMVTVDTAPLHIAQAVGTPVVALFGPTDPHVWGPRGPRDIVLQAPTDCSPCWGRAACGDNRCINALSADRVISAAQALLGEVHCAETGCPHPHLQ
ncbi:MAG: glycosyltransferase family 9 protein [Sporomusaceae bacterium]|nr:glycosyltransferase family 9 protein [Sporomusaceae bacterium]